MPEKVPLTPGNAPVSPIAAGATDKIQSTMATMAQKINDAAQVHAQDIMSDPSKLVQFTQSIMPAIPAPTFNPKTVPSGQLAPEGGGAGDYGDRVAFDKSRLINLIADAANSAYSNHQVSEATKQQKEYELIMMSMQGLNSPDPAIRAQNQAFLNHIFDGKEGKKRAERILKAQGLDATSIEAAMEKANHPDNIAINKAAQNVEAMSKAPVPTGTDGVTPAAPTNTAQPQNNNDPFANLNPIAQAFIKSYPAVGGASVQLSPQGAAMKQLVDAGLIPKADVKLEQSTKYATSVMDNMTKIGIDTSKMLSDEAIAQMKEQNANYRQIVGDESAQKIASLDYAIKAADIGLKQKQQTIDITKMSMDTQDKYVNIAKAGMDAARAKYVEIENNIGRMKDAGKYKGELDKDAENAKAQLDSFERQYSVETNLYKQVGRALVGVPAAPEEQPVGMNPREGETKGSSAVKKFDNKVPFTGSGK